MGGFHMPAKHRMTPEKWKFIDDLIEIYEPKSMSDIYDALKNLMGDTIQGMLEAEQYFCFSRHSHITIYPYYVFRFGFEYFINWGVMLNPAPQ